MKKLLMTLLITLLLCSLALPALAETAAPVPMTWSYLATIAGSAAFAVLVAQLTKLPLDRVWKIPTRLLVYGICCVTMLVATAFTAGLSLNTALLAMCNAALSALSAYGMYELTFAHSDREEDEVDTHAHDKSGGYVEEDTAEYVDDL